MSAAKALMNGVDTMCKAELVVLCEKYGIEGGKTVAQLRYTLKKYYEENGVPEMPVKKAKPDPLSVAHAAASTPASTTAGPTPLPSPTKATSSAAGPSKCPHGAACPELHSYGHRVNCLHDGFRPNPIKCRDGLACLKLKDREHLVKYAHEDSLDKLCKDGANCPQLHVLSHRRAFEHPGFRAQPVPCRDGASCPQIHDKGHLYKYAHDVPDSPASAATAPTSATSAAVPPSPSSTTAAAPTVPASTPVPTPAAPAPPAPAPAPPAPASPPTPTSAPVVAAASISTAQEAPAVAAVKPADSFSLSSLPTEPEKLLQLNIKALVDGKSMTDFPLDAAPHSVLVPIAKDSEEFWELEEKFAANLQGNNEDYVGNRIKAGKKPLRFILIGAERVLNPVLEARYELKKLELVKARETKECRERVSFHGTHPKNIKSILRYSLLRFKHALNPCKSQVDDGYFGTNKKGIYVSRYADYTLKYSNRVCAVDAGDEVKTIMFRTLPGKSKHIPKLVGAVDPTQGYDSHSSPTFLEWYLFDEAQACPAYVLKVKAVEDTRTAADDQ